MKIYIEIFSITLMRKKHHLLDPVYQKPYIQPVNHYYMGKRRSVLIFAFLTNSDDGLKIFTMEVYVEVTTVENWLFRPLSCMLKEYSVNYLKNFKFKLHMWPVSGESLHRTVIVGAKRDVIYSICALSIRIDTRSTNSTEYLKFSHYFVPQMTITHSQRV